MSTLTVAEQIEVEAFIVKIERAKRNLFGCGSRIATFYIKPPDSGKVRLAIETRLKETVGIKWNKKGLNMRDLRASEKRSTLEEVREIFTRR